jgi:hypothetical protein
VHRGGDPLAAVASVETEDGRRLQVISTLPDAVTRLDTGERIRVLGRVSWRAQQCPRCDGKEPGCRGCAGDGYLYRPCPVCGGDGVRDAFALEGDRIVTSCRACGKFALCIKGI